MTQNEIIRMARELTNSVGSHATPCIEGAEMIVAFYNLVAAHELSTVYDEFYMSLQSDLEYGIKSTNERMAEAFKKNYPELNKFCLWLNERMSEYEGDEE